MSKSLSIGKSQISSWDELIQVAKEKIKRLELAIEGFTESKKDGLPLPGSYFKK